MAKKALIFGNGDHAHVIASIIKADYEEIRFIVPEESGQFVAEQIFFERIDGFRSYDIFIGIGDNVIRRKIYEKLGSYDIKPNTCIAPHTFISKGAYIGTGVVICPGAIIMTGARVGDNVIVNTLSSVDHDCVVGNHSQLTAGVIFGGNTTAGENCFFGIRSATIPNITLGDRVVVMAGSLVVRDTPSNIVVGGYPASIIKNNTQN